jgi:hypothetical protein
MTWPEVISQIAAVLITGVVAVLSARYGAKSSLDAAERQVRAALDVAEKNNRAALERVQYERTRQKREEIIEELYAGLRDLERDFLGIAVEGVYETPEVTLEAARKKLRTFAERRGAVEKYHDSRAIWMDQRASQAVDNLVKQYGDLEGIFMTAIYPITVDADGKTKVGKVDEYKIAEARKKLRRWFHKEYPKLNETIRTSLQDSLNAVPTRTDE